MKSYNIFPFLKGKSTKQIEFTRVSSIFSKTPHYWFLIETGMSKLKMQARTAKTASQRYALRHLFKLHNPSGDPLFDDEDLTKALESLKPALKEQVRDLRDYGWRYVDQSSDSIKRVLNCPPVVALETKRNALCGRYMFCPWCWARKVVGVTFSRAQRLLSSPEGKFLDLYGMVEYSYLAYDKFNAGWAAVAASERLKRYKRLMDMAEAAGSFHMITVEPGDGDSGWRLTLRVLAALPMEFSSEMLPGVLCKEPSIWGQRALALVNEAQLALIVGRVCEYPLQMMTGDPKDVAEILESRGGPRGDTLRLSVNYGLFRNSKGKDA